MGLFGGGNSSSSSTSITDTQDNRIQAAQNSSNLNNSRGVINGDVNMLDGGAIGKSFDFATKIADGAANTMAASAGAQGAVMLSAMGAVQQAYQDQGASLADAYKTSKAGEQKVLVAGALLIGAIVAIKILGKG